MVENAKGCSFDASGRILRVSKGNKEMLWGKKTGGLYRLEGNVQTGGATVRHGSNGISEKSGQGKQPLHRGTQSKRRGTWRIRSGTRAQGDALGYVRKSGQTRVMQPVQDVHREAQRKETKSILRSCTLCAQGRRDGATTTRKVTYFAAHPDGGCGAPQWGVQGHLGEKVQGTSVWKCIHFGGKWSSPLMRLRGKDRNEPSKSSYGEKTTLLWHKVSCRHISGLCGGQQGLEQGVEKPVYLLDITSHSQYLKDDHPTAYSSAHSGTYCGHRCLPGLPDTWNQLLNAALIR
ncbi:similar to TRICHOME BIREFRINGENCE-LIKE 37 [Actinidia rufa]|uniref:Similar to TRICHOME BIREFRINGENCE-LIKE 37 n=1 Tax=Actinidia rufa TaxID=165716 RepID=A0A7J0DYY0_9ERIC|nr:similar to TRICHOME BIREFRINGENCE-LIKE 37 [Actinidia rufa]